MRYFVVMCLMNGIKNMALYFLLNRREVLYYNVNIGSLEDMKILKKMEEKYKVKVNITF